MNKNTYLGLALTACLSVASTPLLAEVVPAPEHPANITAPGTSTIEPLESSELQRQQVEDDKANINITEPLEPSELQRQQVEGDKANITEPGTSVTEPLEPSENQRQQAEHDKANITAPGTSATEPLEPSELQRQQGRMTRLISLCLEHQLQNL